jgi:TRAF3-interacting protein 1
MSFIEETQRVLGKIISKPPLTEKYLKRPPYQYIHDIVVNVMKKTGFMEGLFSDDELQKGVKVWVPLGMHVLLVS